MLYFGAMSANQLDRRTVLRSAAVGAAAFSAGSYNRILGANGQIQLGLIGCGGRGVRVLEQFVKNDSIRPFAMQLTEKVDVFYSTYFSLTTEPGHLAADGGAGPSRPRAL